MKANRSVLSGVVLLCLAASAGAQAEPLTRAQAVARALEVNPQVQKAVYDIALYKGGVTEAMADALPELDVWRHGLRYRDPSLLNSSSFDAFPPELRDSLRPVAANLFDGAALAPADRLQLQARRGDPRRPPGHDVRPRTAPQPRGRWWPSRRYGPTTSSCSPGRRCRWPRTRSPRRRSTWRWRSNRRAAGVATDLDVLRSQVDLENTRSVLLACSAAEADPRAAGSTR